MGIRKWRTFSVRRFYPLRIRKPNLIFSDKRGNGIPRMVSKVTKTGRPDGCVLASHFGLPCPQGPDREPNKF